MRAGFVAYQPGSSSTPAPGRPRASAHAAGAAVPHDQQGCPADRRGVSRTCASSRTPSPAPRHGNIAGVVQLLQAFNLEDSHAKFGLVRARTRGRSARTAAVQREVVDPPAPRRRLPARARGEVRRRPGGRARALAGHPGAVPQLGEVVDAFDTGPDVAARSSSGCVAARFLGDIDPARVGISGATDFDHDVECQRILAALLRRRTCAADGIFAVEPRFSLPLDTSTRPWSFAAGAAGSSLSYQPDAELRERDEGRTRRSRRGVRAVPVPPRRLEPHRAVPRLPGHRRRCRSSPRCCGSSSTPPPANAATSS